MTGDTAVAIDVQAMAPLGYDEAMQLASTETERVLQLAGSLSDEEWLRPTECPGWAVRDVLAHLLGMWHLQADPEERDRQLARATEAAASSGRVRLDELTDLQVRERRHLSPRELVEQMRAVAPVALAARRSLPEQMRDTPYDPQLPGEDAWTLGYLFGVIHTRDPWMHRVDIACATGRALTLTAEHDGRLVADVVREWAQRHGSPFTLTLTGAAGGTYVSGTGGALYELDAVEFCRILSQRAEATGLLRVAVPF